MTVGLLAAGGCGGGEGGGALSVENETPDVVDREARRGRLQARPRNARSGAERAGTRALGAPDRADGLLHVPAGYSPARPPALVVLLHGAGSDARSGLGPLRELADEAGLMLLAPTARGRTWDAILDRFGPDVASLDALLEQVFERFAVDRSHVALGGFSDGASYALSLGLSNGDLFTDVIAFSPGFLAPGARRGRPSIYVSHGVEDRVLPIVRCSRTIVPALRRSGYDVEYREFQGGHTVPAEIARAAVSRLRRPDERG